MTNKRPDRQPCPPLEGLNERLDEELEQANLSGGDKVRFLAEITGLSEPTARRWLAKVRPQWPDLAALVQICMRLGTDVNWLLGFTPRRLPLPVREVAADGDAGRGTTGRLWLEQVAGSIAKILAQDCDQTLMQGDAMAPGISDGDVLFVDRSIRIVSGNGLYELEYAGRTLIRNVEDRSTDGLVLSCSNPAYEKTLVAPKDVRRLRVLGRVRCSVGARRH